MSAFDNTERQEEGPADHLIGEFDYLNTSARPEAARVRSLIDSWLEDYPVAHRPDLVHRLRSRNDTSYRSAFFELFLHALLLRHRFRIVAIEPELANGRAPDFLVEAPEGTRFYLEATLATGMGDEEAGADRRMREALQAIDSVESPDFFLQVHTRGIPALPIAVGRLRRAVQQYVNGLDYAAAVEAAQANRPIGPIWRHEEHGVEFTVQSVPKRARRASGRAIGARMLPGGIVQPNLAIKSAVERKAGRYGNLDLPLVIAVNTLEIYAGVDDAIDALFGTVVVVAPMGGTPREERNGDGAWQGPGGPVHTRSSAVLFVERLSGWSLAQRTARLILNPWAQKPLLHPHFGLETLRVVDNRLIAEPGQSLREVFDLPEDWPE